MIEFKGSIPIECSPETVFAFVADPTNRPKYDANVVDSRLVTDGPVRVGTRFEEGMKMGPWRLRSACEVLTHEAPRPFYPVGRRIDAGKTVLNDVLAAMKPRLHLFGHHHEFTDSMRHDVRSIGLDVVTKSYLLINAETFKTERVDT